MLGELRFHSHIHRAISTITTDGFPFRHLEMLGTKKASNVVIYTQITTALGQAGTASVRSY